MAKRTSQWKHLICSPATHTVVRHSAFMEGRTMSDYVDAAVLAYANRLRRSGEDE